MAFRGLGKLASRFIHRNTPYPLTRSDQKAKKRRWGVIEQEPLLQPDSQCVLTSPKTFKPQASTHIPDEKKGPSQKECLPERKKTDLHWLKNYCQRWMPCMNPNKTKDLKVQENFSRQQANETNRKSVICLKRKVEDDQDREQPQKKLRREEPPSPPSIPKGFNALEGPLQKSNVPVRKRSVLRDKIKPLQNMKPDLKGLEDLKPFYSPGPSSPVAPAQKENGKTYQPSSSSIPSGFHALEGRPYLQGSKLGQGGFGTVYAGIRIHDGLPVAIKYVSKETAKTVQDPQLGLVPLEVALMLQVSSPVACPNIVSLLDWFEQPDHYVMILEHPYPCKDLSSFPRSIGNLDEEMAKNVMLQLINALQHCERSGVLHRDVKPENILFCTDTKQIKLLDFGCGDFLMDIYKRFLGTCLYCPPEFFRYGRYQARPQTAWSLGITLFKLLTGSVPFCTQVDIINNLLSVPDFLSKECGELIQWCLEAKPDDRPSLEQIIEHPWFQ